MKQAVTGVCLELSDDEDYVSLDENDLNDGIQDLYAADSASDEDANYQLLSNNNNNNNNNASSKKKKRNRKKRDKYNNRHNRSNSLENINNNNNNNNPFASLQSQSAMFSPQPSMRPSMSLESASNTVPNNTLTQLVNAPEFVPSSTRSTRSIRNINDDKDKDKEFQSGLQMEDQRRRRERDRLNLRRNDRNNKLNGNRSQSRSSYNMNNNNNNNNNNSYYRSNHSLNRNHNNNNNRSHHSHHRAHSHSHSNNNFNRNNMNNNMNRSRPSNNNRFANKPMPHRASMPMPPQQQYGQQQGYPHYQPQGYQGQTYHLSPQQQAQQQKQNLMAQQMAQLNKQQQTQQQAAYLQAHQQAMLQQQQQQQGQQPNPFSMPSLTSSNSAFSRNKKDDDDDSNHSAASSSEEDDNDNEAAAAMEQVKLTKRLQKLQELSARKHRAKKSGKRKVLHKQKVNANVISIELGTLKESAANINSGDPIKCGNKNCGAIFSKYDCDKLLKEYDDIKLDDEDDQIWICRFCNKINIIDIDKEEMPKDDTIDYMLEPPQEEEKTTNNADEGSSKQIIFCIDISGSMCVSKEIKNKKHKKLKLKGNRLQKDKDNLSQFVDHNAMALNQSDIQYVSRLQCLQACVDEQLSEISKQSPLTKIGLVTFNDQVTCYGDAMNENNIGYEIIAGDKLNNLEKLKEIGINSEKCKINNNINKSKENLIDAIWKLEESGQTALGPALTVSIAQASLVRGSQVILCTDGLANRGVGKIDNETDETVNEFYENLGKWALDKGVSVSIVSITGDGCKLESLGKVVETTGGNLRRIDPLKLTDTFSNILQDSIVATHANATMLLHPGLQFVDTAEKLKKLNPFENEQQDKNEKDKDKNKEEAAEIIKEKTTLEGPGNDGSSDKKEDNDDNDNDKEIKDKTEKKEENDDESTKREIHKIGRSLKEVGNVFGDTTLFFEYGVDRKKIKKFKDLKSMPFQVHILYKKIDGTKMLRVITQEMKTTKDKKSIRENLDYSVLSKYGTRISTNLCQIGDYEASRAYMNANARYLNRNAMNNNNLYQQQQQLQHVGHYVNNNIALDYQMAQQQQQEIAQPQGVMGMGMGMGGYRGGGYGGGGYNNINHHSHSHNSHSNRGWHDRSMNSDRQQQSRQGQRSDKFSSIHHGMKRKF